MWLGLVGILQFKPLVAQTCNSKNYERIKLNSKVYIYNNKGVSATIPFQAFIKPNNAK